MKWHQYCIQSSDEKRMNRKLPVSFHMKRCVVRLTFYSCTYRIVVVVVIFNSKRSEWKFIASHRLKKKEKKYEEIENTTKKVFFFIKIRKVRNVNHRSEMCKRQNIVCVLVLLPLHQIGFYHLHFIKNQKFDC